MAVSKDISLDRPTLKSRTDPPGLTPSKEAFALLYERENAQLAADMFNDRKIHESIDMLQSDLVE